MIFKWFSNDLPFGIVNGQRINAFVFSFCFSMTLSASSTWSFLTFFPEIGEIVVPILAKSSFK